MSRQMLENLTVFLFPVTSWKEMKTSNDMVVIAAAVKNFNDQTSVSFFFPVFFLF